MNQALKVLGVLSLMYGVPIAAIRMTAEEPMAVGITDVPGSSQLWAYKKPGSDTRVYYHNYWVYRNARTVVYYTGLMPNRILMRDGKITRVSMLFLKLLPVNFYEPANQEEAALWLKYFG